MSADSACYISWGGCNLQVFDALERVVTMLEKQLETFKSGFKTKCIFGVVDVNSSE